LTGVPVLLNMSFNIQEPIVCTPEEALATFARSGVDALALGNYWGDSSTHRRQLKFIDALYHKDTTEVHERMRILGMSALDKESTATLVEDGKIIAAISEERITSVKQQSWFPFRSLERILSEYKLTPADIDKGAFAFCQSSGNGNDGVSDIGRM
jgi:predicted NodU family carbamoyl transferase